MTLSLRSIALLFCSALLPACKGNTTSKATPSAESEGVGQEQTNAATPPASGSDPIATAQPEQANIPTKETESQAAAKTSTPPELAKPDEDQELDLDGDGKDEHLRMWCDVEEGVIDLQVNDAKLRIEPELSELVGCDIEFARAKGHPTRMWIFAHEHDEAGAGRNLLLRYHGGDISEVWAKTVQIDIDSPTSWSTSEGWCDEDSGEEFSRKTVYRISRKGKVSSKTTKKTTPGDPDDCVDFDP